MNITTTFADAMGRFGVSSSQSVAVAVSGGADSMALTLLANQWANTPIIAVTVDHALREESRYEAEQVGRWLAKYNISHHILTWQGDKKAANIQAEARSARYNLMSEFCQANGISNLLVAHNKDDQAETVLLRLMRGSGVDGLCGMYDDVQQFGIRILRPLLAVENQYIKEYLREHKQGWVEDPSNKDDKYARVQVRNFIENSPEPDLLIRRLNDTASNMQRSRSYIEAKIAEDMAAVADMQEEGYCLLDAGAFKLLHEEAGLKILSSLIKAIGGQYYKPRFEKLEKLYLHIMQEDKIAGHTLGGCEIYSSAKKDQADKIIIARENSATQGDIKIVAGAKVVWDERFICHVNDPKSSLSVGPLGEDGFAQLLRQDENLKKCQLPKKIIYTIPAFKNLENIIAAPHIDYYSDKNLKGKLIAELALRI